MSRDSITRWKESDSIRAYCSIEPLEPAPIYRGWTSYSSQRSVQAIAIAPKSGKIWLATWGGVLSWNQADDFFYRRYGSEHGLAGNAVACICVDDAERAWVGQGEGGLSYFDSQRWKLYPHLGVNEQIRTVRSAEKAGGIWAATNRTVYRITDPASHPSAQFTQHNSTVDTLALLADGEGLLIGNPWGLFRLQKNGEAQPIEEATIETCVALSRDALGRVWIGTPDAVYRIAGDVLEGPFIPPDKAGRIISIAAGQAGAWVLTATGLAQIADGKWKEIPRQKPFALGLNSQGGIPSSALRAIASHSSDHYTLVGTDNLLWRASYSKQAGPIWESLLLADPKDKLNNLSYCSAQQPSDGTVLVGTAGGLIEFDRNGAWRLDSEYGDVLSICVPDLEDGADAREHRLVLSWPNQIGLLDSLNARSIGLPLASALGLDGHAHVMTTCGLWRLDTNVTPLATGCAPKVRCMAQMPDGVWWLGTARGVYRLAANGWSLAGEQPGPRSAEVYVLAVIDGALWAATEAGLWSRQFDGWVLHDDEGGEKPRQVQALAAAGNSGALWLAREDGVRRYDPLTGETSPPYTPLNSGLASYRVTSLLQSDGVLWITTCAGISRLNL